jgi:hypothetical protein
MSISRQLVRSKHLDATAFARESVASSGYDDIGAFSRKENLFMSIPPQFHDLAYGVALAAAALP